jgi:hypothetical protein
MEGFSVGAEVVNMCMNVVSVETEGVSVCTEGVSVGRKFVSLNTNGVIVCELRSSGSLRSG